MDAAVVHIPIHTFIHSVLRKFVGEKSDFDYHDKNEVYNPDTMKIIEWHKRYNESWQRKLGLTDYQFLWLAFFKGILVTVIVYLLVCIF